MTLDELEQLREGWDFEAKKAAGRDGGGAVPSSFWETYSAMANTDGGVVVLGVVERPDGTLDVVGVPDIDKLETELWNNVAGGKKVSANVLMRDAVQRVAVGTNAALVITIPKAPRHQRPVFLDGSWERTYLRVHESDRIASREVARRMLADAQPERDAGVIEGFNIADLHPDTVRRYRNVLASQRPDHPFLGGDDRHLLRRLGALDERRGDAVSFAGLLMFGREDALRRRFPHWHLSYKEVPNSLPGDARWVDRVWPDGTWNANVYEFYSRVIHKLHEGLKVPFALEGSQHRIDDTPAHKAVREAVVNTLIHADYQGPTGIRVVRSPGGFEFINPGLLLVSAQQVWTGGVSQSRNPTLQRMFGLIQLGEREGSGGPAIRQAWAQQHWRAPVLREDTENAETHLELSMASLLPPEAVEEAMRILGDRFDALDELCRLIVVKVVEEGSVTHAGLTELSRAHGRDLTLALHKLKKQRVLRSEGVGKATTYLLHDGEPSSAGSEQSASSKARTNDFSKRYQGSSEQSSEQTSEQSSKRGWEPLDRQLEAVLLFCLEEWRTLPQIAAELNRSEHTVRTNYLEPLLGDGRLERRFPSSPRHPHQAYRTRPTERSA